MRCNEIPRLSPDAACEKEKFQPYIISLKPGEKRAGLSFCEVIPMKQACDSCGRIPAEAALIPFDGQLLCPACLEQATTFCSHCGSRIWNEENAGDSQTPLSRSAMYFMALFYFGIATRHGATVWKRSFYLCCGRISP